MSFVRGLLFLVFASSSIAAPIDALILPLREVDLSATLPGTIAEQPLKEGAAVTAGTPLARFHDAEERLTRDRLAKILEKRRTDAEKSSGLFRDKVVTEDEALQARIEFEIAEIDLALAEARLHRRTVSAPFDGIVTKLAFEVGEWVEPGQLVARLAQIDQLYARILVPAAEAQRLTVGTAATVRFPDLDLPDTQATVDRIDPQIDVTSGLRRVDLLLSNPRHLITPGARATVDFAN